VSDKVHKTSITINSSINENTEDLNIDSLIIASFNNSIKADLNNLKNIEFDSVVNQINDFKCYGFIADNNMTKKQVMYYYCNKKKWRIQNRYYFHF
jgi:hypothetical protein